MNKWKPQMDSERVNKVRTSLWLAALVAVCGLITLLVVRPDADRENGTSADASQAQFAQDENSTSTPRLHRSAAGDAPIESPSELTVEEAEAREEDRLLALKLREELSADPKNVSKILDLIRGEKDPNRLYLLASVITGFPEAGEQEAVTTLALELLNNPECSACRQAGAFMLFHTKALSPELVDGFADMSRLDESREVRMAAMAAMHTWLDRSPEMSADISRRLIENMRGNPHSVQERGHAIQAIALAEAKVPLDVVQALVRQLPYETDSNNRGLMAMAIGNCTPEARPYALGELQAAYGRETDLNARRNLMTYIARLGLRDAIPILAQLDTSAPELSGDAQDYRDLLQGNFENFDEVWDKKYQRDIQRGTVIVYGN
jgi:hypothetical protein